VNGLASDADEVVCLETPSTFFAIGQFYSDFSQTSDQEVVDCLTRAGQGPEDGPGPARGRLPARDAEVEVDAGGLRLAGHLTVPEGAGGIVVFAHGSGSSRHSPRNRYVASVLTAAGLGTLLFDLLTPREELDRGNVFDIALLARRLADATRWLRGEPEGAARIGYFGASTGAAAALWAAADAGDEVGAVVSRGGRPDLAGARLADVRAPTLLVVGGDDRAVLELNQKARTLLRCESRLEVVPGATHLFEEPGTLTTAADLARDWFATHLG
jgi:putative phosphoribosyl transferase